MRRKKKSTSIENALIRPVAWRILEASIDKKTKPLNVFARTACMGNAILARSFRASRLNILNAQKCHIDYLNLISLGIVNFEQVIDDYEFQNSNTQEWYKQLRNENLMEFFLRADFGLFDSFCELTDLKLEIYKGVYMYGNTGDFTEKELNYRHLISLDESWKRFLQIVETKYRLNPKSPIIYLHYSSNNDSRNWFRNKSNVLLGYAESLEKEVPTFKVLKLNEEQYTFSENDYLPYHYGQSTLDSLTNKFSSILSEFGIKTNRYLVRI
jgi:hypothetical protein